MENKNYIGIDVSKSTLDVAVHENTQSWSFGNNESEITKLVLMLKELNPELVIMEASENLEMPLAAELAMAGIVTAIVNPKQVMAFAKSVVVQGKTDKLKARVLALFAATIHPETNKMADVQIQELREFLTRRRQLVEMLNSEKNRLPSAARILKPDIKDHIQWIETELAEHDKRIWLRIQISPLWREKDDLLKIVPGNTV